MTAYFLDSSALVKRYAREIGACASVCNPLPVFIYLAVVLDAFSRRVIGWALERSLETELALGALRMALSARTVSAELVHHSDRGVQ